MGKNKKNKSMGIVPSSYYEMNVDQVILPEDDAPPTDVDGNAVYEEVLKTAEEILEQARNIGVNTIGEELSKSEADLGVIDVVAEEEKKDDNLSQKQKQQKGGYNGWWWWRK
jgi:hypothetical protein